MASNMVNASGIHQKDDNFKFYKPHTRGNAARITKEQWKPHYSLIRGLHHARKTRAQILEILYDHGLEPTSAQLYAKMSKWGLKGYGPGVHIDADNQVELTSDKMSKDNTPHAATARETPSKLTTRAEYASEGSQESTEPSDCFSNEDNDDAVHTSDTMYETDLGQVECNNECSASPTSTPEPVTTDAHLPQSVSVDDMVEADGVSNDTGIDFMLQSNTPIQRLPTDLMHFVHSSTDIEELDKQEILNEVSCFLCVTNSFSDAFVLFEATYKFLKTNRESHLALVFATINCLRSATFKEQCQYAGSLMGEALAALRITSYTDPHVAAAFTSLEAIGHELCHKSELEYLNILYSQIECSQTFLSSHAPSRTEENAYLLHCSDPFLVATDGAQPLSQSTEMHGITLGRLVGKLSRWCITAIDDFNPIDMLPSAGFNPSDPVSVERFATALCCHFIRKWSFLSLEEVLDICNELLPPNSRGAAGHLCKLAVRVLSTLAAYTIYQATGTTLRSVTGHSISLSEAHARYTSPLASHLDVLCRMRSNERVLVFAEVNKTLYNRTLVYRQQMDDHCLMAYVRETGFLLAASLIRFKRELYIEVPKPTMSGMSRTSTPPPTCSIASSLSRRSSGSSASMRNCAKRNLLVPGIMSRHGSHLRRQWVRRMSTDSNESWDFTKVTGLPSGPSPPESIRDETRDGSMSRNDDDKDCHIDPMEMEMEFF